MTRGVPQWQRTCFLISSTSSVIERRVPRLQGCWSLHFFHSATFAILLPRSWVVFIALRRRRKNRVVARKTNSLCGAKNWLRFREESRPTRTRSRHAQSSDNKEQIQKSSIVQEDFPPIANFGASSFIDYRGILEFWLLLQNCFFDKFCSVYLSDYFRSIPRIPFSYSVLWRCVLSRSFPKFDKLSIRENGTFVWAESKFLGDVTKRMRNSLRNGFSPQGAVSLLEIFSRTDGDRFFFTGRKLRIEAQLVIFSGSYES